MSYSLPQVINEVSSVEVLSFRSRRKRDSLNRRHINEATIPDKKQKAVSQTRLSRISLSFYENSKSKTPLFEIRRVEISSPM